MTLHRHHSLSFSLTTGVVSKFILLEQYEWAMSMVISRSYDVEGRRYLLPGLDFFNHCNDGDVNQVDVDIFENTIYVLTSKRHVRMKELCINFSRLEKMPRKDSILQYGFG